MYAVIQDCPICKQPLEVTRLHCRNCDTSVEGHFALGLGRFHCLTPEQLRFAETFIKCEGKITRVEDELSIPYPTVRARLHELIKAMGYEVAEDGPSSAPPIDRQAILAQLADGTISAEEAARKRAGN